MVMPFYDASVVSYGMLLHGGRGVLVHGDLADHLLARLSVGHLGGEGDLEAQHDDYDLENGTP